jgi:hypothetical protein
MSVFRLHGRENRINWSGGQIAWNRASRFRLYRSGSRSAGNRVQICW